MIAQTTATILIVDDDADICLTLQDILDMEGYTAVTAQGGRAALDIARNRVFDAVLMDVKMPDLNGVQTFRLLRDIAPHTPVIMMTAFAVSDLLDEALALGACGALRKPVDFDELFTTIERCLKS